MFTGLVEEVSKIQVLAPTQNGARLFLMCNFAKDVKIGDSIAVNGTCLTVVEIKNNQLAFDIAPESLKITTFATAKTGDFVNLERALTLNERLGGHIVSGHIDGTAKFVSSHFDGLAHIMSFRLPQNLVRYVIKKGSICINGISLTIAKIEDDVIFLSIIPHTYQNTNLQYLKNGDFVNIEVDVIAKYIEKFVHSSDNNTITENFLREHGF